LPSSLRRPGGCEEGLAIMTIDDPVIAAAAVGEVNLPVVLPS
jgi:hypothetical protein